jgi:hypothetical protein
MNIRHDLTKEEVAGQLERKVQQLLKDKQNAMNRAILNCADYAVRVKEGDVIRHWSRKPDTPEYFNGFYNRLIAQEQEYYSKVRIIELPNKGTKKYILVYGDKDDAAVESGTGPFESIEKAKEWYLNGGR